MTEFIKAISPYVGAVTTSLIGSLSPDNVILAPLIGSAIQSNLEILGNEIQNRKFSKNENERVAECFGYALLKISERLEKGNTLRDDNFFIAEHDDYSSGDKLLELAFINSRNEIEKKKLKYISFLIANSLFEKHPFERTLHFLKIAEKINWRQFCQIALVHEKDRMNLESKLIKGGSKVVKSIDFRLDILELVELKVLKGPYSMLKDNIIIIPEYELDWIGIELLKLMELDSIPDSELEKYV